MAEHLAGNGDGGSGNHSHEPDERTHLLGLPKVADKLRRLSAFDHSGSDRDRASSIASSRRRLNKDEQLLAHSGIGERLNYNEYTTIDWLHDLVKDSYRLRKIHLRPGLRGRLLAAFDSCQGWLAVAIMGTLTACVAFIVDICEATVSDWKLGYCKRNPLMNREACCEDKTPFFGTYSGQNIPAGTCHEWHRWSDDWWKSFAIYGGFALAFGIISGTATLFTKRPLPQVQVSITDLQDPNKNASKTPSTGGKALYMAAGAGIAEIKCILSGFEMPGFLSFRVLFVKAFGATFAVATGMCLGKEGPFVHISGCVGWLVAQWFPKYRNNGRKLREILSAAVAAGLSVAFGAPIGGVLFAYEEISTYFPRKVLWRAFLCSMFAAIVLKALNPTGTGKLVLFETDYGTSYKPQHYLVFVLLGVAGGLWGGIFCRANFIWSKWFRSYSIIKNYPVFEVFLVVLVTVLLQYPNPVTRDSGDIIISNLLVNCKHKEALAKSWPCQQESMGEQPNLGYIAWLVFGCLVKLGLTIVTFGAKVPSGIIIPALDAGAIFGRLVGQFVTTISPGIFAMVGAGAFLAGVSRMTISLCVIMFELTGELEFVLPHMIAILVAKWVADALSRESVYDLAQVVLGHPFLDAEHMIQPVQQHSPSLTLESLIPPRQTMDEITVVVSPDGMARFALLQSKLARLKERGLLDAGLVLVDEHGFTKGYIGEAELDFGLTQVGLAGGDANIVAGHDPEALVRLFGGAGAGADDSDGIVEAGGRIDVETAHLADPAERPGQLDLSAFVDTSPVSLPVTAPLEYAVEAFGKLGLRHLVITTSEPPGRLAGVCLKKRLLGVLEGLRH